MFFNFLFVAIGIAMLVVGGDLLIDGGSNIGKRFGMSDRIVGLTICAVGTSMPEVFVSVTSAMGGNADVAVGNIVGSNMANLLLILGITAVILPMNLAHRTTRFEVPLSIVAIMIFALFANTNGYIGAVEGGVLLACFAFFIVNSVLSGQHEDEDDKAAGIEQVQEPVKKHSVLRDLIFIAGSIALLKYGADFVVDNAVIIASELGVSQRIIGLTIVSIGTSLPELVTSTVAAFKGNTDAAVGNVVGSNISNLFLVAGAPALFSPVGFSAAYNLDLILLGIFSICLVVFTFIGTTRTFSRRCGVLFIMFYVCYIAMSFVR